MGRVHQIDVMCPLCLQHKKNFGQPIDRNLFSKIPRTDLSILAEAAAQRASREKDSARSVLTADTGFLPKVQGSTRHPHLISAAAVSLPGCAVSPADARTKPAIRNPDHFWVCASASPTSCASTIRAASAIQRLHGRSSDISFFSSSSRQITVPFCSLNAAQSFCTCS